MRVFSSPVLLCGLVALTTLTTGCGKDSSQGTPQDANQAADANPDPCSGTNVETGIRLKGVGLLSRTYNDVLGAKSDVSVINSEERLFETYRGNFGGNEGLGYGDIYADNLNQTQTMTAYFLGLNYVAYNAALQCENKGRQGLCACENKESALEMLKRAIPSLTACEQQGQSLAEEFSALCQDNYIDAVTSLMSSVAVAKRN